MLQVFDSIVISNGQARRVTIVLSRYDLSIWDVDRDGGGRRSDEEYSKDLFFHFVIIPLMLPALLIFLTYMLTCYSFTHLLICLAEHITTLSSFLLLSKIQYLKNLYVKAIKQSRFLSLSS